MRTQSTHAEAAKMMKRELNKKFSCTKFKVKSDSFSGGTSIHVEWDNGPTNEKVEEIVSKYQYGHFDGMTDCYEYSNKNSHLPQVKYVQTRRNYTNEIVLSEFEFLKKNFTEIENLTDLDECNDFFRSRRCWTAREYIHTALSKRNF